MDQQRIKAYKIASYSAITFSVIAVLSVCIALPMIHSYVTNLQAQMANELAFCHVSLLF